MHPRARRAVSFALSVAVHALLLLEIYGLSVVQPGFPEQPPLPVRIIDQPRPRPRAAPKPPPQQMAAKPPEAAKPVEQPPPPEPPPPQQPERKIPLPEQQIVSPPDAGKNEAPPDTRLLSDRDNRVEQQMVKRGEPLPGEQAPPEKAAKPAPPKPQEVKPAERRGGRTQREPPPRVAALPGLDRLMPDALRLAQESYAAEPAPQAGEQLAQANQSRRLQPRGAEGIMMPAGPIGTMDFLPDVREGDITLLNTKAEVFAPFVRRVALRVFQNFLISLKRDLAGSSIPTTEMVEAEAVMDARGEMIGYNVHRRSARISLASDRRLQQACHDGFFDRNPPPGARAKDGNIHFMLVLAVEYQPGPRGGGYWVAMSAGLG